MPQQPVLGRLKHCLYCEQIGEIGRQYDMLYLCWVEDILVYDAIHRWLKQNKKESLYLHTFRWYTTSNILSKYKVSNIS